MTEPLEVLPFDVHNRELVQNVHPPAWVNPTPAPIYNLVAIGAGAAGLVSSAGTAGLGGKAALIERAFLGGDCLNVGCVPSKALIRAARAAADVRDAGNFGVVVPPGVAVNFPAVMERIRRLRASISPNDSAERFRNLGVDVFLGSGRFTGRNSIEVEGQTLHFRKAVITAGARASQLPIPGLADVGYLTNETVFSLTELPRRLAVIGAGPIGCELAQCFARFGAKVTLLEVASRIMPLEDAQAVEQLEKALHRDGVEIIASCSIRQVVKEGGNKVLRYTAGNQEGELRADEILVGGGRTPNVDGLNLDVAGVAYDDKTGVHVNDYLQTSNPNIYAAGDICSRFKFTHAADAMARLVLKNALFFRTARVSALTIPWCTYTDPEIAHVGLYEHEAAERGIPITTVVQEFRDLDRAVLDGETDGFCKVHFHKKKGTIQGATLVARHAGDMIAELTLAMTAGLKFGAIVNTIHPYPTQAEAIRKAADAYNRTRLTPFVKWLLQKWLAWKRGS
jgi:pyruvate/2-oxoglutarate dehydrogenase complex dihydrolipoamide dehydrogenase (E3) component